MGHRLSLKGEGCQHVLGDLEIGERNGDGGQVFTYSRSIREMGDNCKKSNLTFMIILNLEIFLKELEVRNGYHSDARRLLGILDFLFFKMCIYFYVILFICFIFSYIIYVVNI